jgi:hypothetical protein
MIEPRLAAMPGKTLHYKQRQNLSRFDAGQPRSSLTSIAVPIAGAAELAGAAQ